MQSSPTTSHYHDRPTIRKSPSGRALPTMPSPPPLPDPSLFPDPYPSGFAGSTMTTPPVSVFSAGSSSARSSAYTSASPGSALRSSVASSDSAHGQQRPPLPLAAMNPNGMSGLPDAYGMQVQHQSASAQQSPRQYHQPPPDMGDYYGGLETPYDERQPYSPVGVATTADEVAYSHAQPLPSAVARRVTSRPGSRPSTFAEPEHTRWSSSDKENSGRESRASSWGNFDANMLNQPTQQSGSYDWNGSGEPSGSHTDDEADDDDVERSAAVLLAEQGKGHIVHGEGIDVHALDVPLGTTHLLLGASPSSGLIPNFLATVLPPISETLLALDISANFLGSAPPALASCLHLEELNLSSNPLRALPTWLGGLTSLRVLIVDSTGITTIPTSFSGLNQIHTLSIRRNRLHSLPSWLCLLPALETLYIEGNPFQGPWKALLEPLVPRVTPVSLPRSPMYPPNTPHTANTFTSSASGDSDYSDEVRRGHHQGAAAAYDDRTITDRFGEVSTPQSALQAPNSPPWSQGMGGMRPNTTVGDVASHRLSRTNTAPTRRGSRPMSFLGSQLATLDSGQEQGYIPPEIGRRPDPQELNLPPPPESPLPSPMRRMKSAGDLNRGDQARSIAKSMHESSGYRPSQYEEDQDPRFMSLGSRGPPKEDYRSLTATMFEPPTPSFQPGFKDKDPKKWGIFKKMSKSKLKATPEPTYRLGPPRPMPPPSSQSTPVVPKLGVNTSGFKSATSLHGTPSSPPRRLTKPPSASALATAMSSGPTLMIGGPGSPKQLTAAASTPNLLAVPPSPGPSPRTAKRRSFFPLDGPTPLSIPHPSLPHHVIAEDDLEMNSPEQLAERVGSTTSVILDGEYDDSRERERYSRALRSVMAYLRDMCDLNASTSQGAAAVALSATKARNEILGLPTASEWPPAIRSRAPTLYSSEPTRAMSSDSTFSAGSATMSSLGAGTLSMFSQSTSSTGLTPMSAAASAIGLNTPPSISSQDGAGDRNSTGSIHQEEKKYKDDKAKRAYIVKEIVTTERTYVKQIQELVDIYVKPSAQLVTGIANVSSKETVVPASERRIVFNGLDSLFTFHKESFLPSLEKAYAKLEHSSDVDGEDSVDAALSIARVFVSHAAFMRMYSTYINNFDNAVQRVQKWNTDKPSTPAASGSSSVAATPNASTANLGNNAGADGLTASQKKRIRQYLKRCHTNPRRSQISLEAYLLLPVQRIPRYKLLLEDLVRSTPPKPDAHDDPLDQALTEITVMATNINEEKRDSESRSKLVQWQGRIRGRFPSPLVQPHRRLIMDGRLQLTRVVRKIAHYFEVINAEGDKGLISVECLQPEVTPRHLYAVLCNDLLVLCKDPSAGKDPNSPVDLWAVLRMQTVPQPASIVHGNALRLVDNKAILYFDIASAADAVTWARAINMHIPASAAK